MRCFGDYTFAHASHILGLFGFITSFHSKTRTIKIEFEIIFVLRMRDLF